VPTKWLPDAASKSCDLVEMVSGVAIKRLVPTEDLDCS
jgi:hypothetical protein